MKKILAKVMLFIAMLGGNEVQGQTRWGVVAGVDFTNLSFDQDLFTINQNVGATAGVTGELMIPGIGFGVDASLLYTQRGATLNLGERPLWSSQGYGKENMLLHYLEIPIHLKFKFKNLNGLENTIMPILFAGPEFSFLVGHSNIKAMEYAGGEFGIDVGVGCEILQRFQVNASYCWGMSYALKTKQLDDFSARNRCWKLACTYFF